MLIFIWLMDLFVQISSNNDVSHTKVLIYQPAVIPCRLTVTPNVSNVAFQWSINMFGYEKETIEKMTKGRMYIPNKESGVFDLYFIKTLPNDKGIYICQIDLLEGDVHKSLQIKNNLEVIDPPDNFTISITPSLAGNHPQILWIPNQNRIIGLPNEQVTLKCSFKGGYPVPQIAWKFITRQSSYLHSKGENTTSFDLTDLIHNSNISCSAANKDDYMSASISETQMNIRVLYIKNLRIVRSNGRLSDDIMEGESVSFTCEAQMSSELDPQYSWFFELDNGENVIMQTKLKSNTVVFKVSQKHHRGKLHCSVNGTVSGVCPNRINERCFLHLQRNVSTSGPFNVIYPPKIKDPFQTITVDAIGDSVTLPCEVNANPTATIRWFKTDVGTSKSARSINWYHHTAITNLVESLKFNNVIGNMEHLNITILNEAWLDIYICEAQSAMNQKVYKYVLVAEREKPTIKIDRLVTKVKSDGTASLMCLFESWPKLSASSVKWYKVGNEEPLLSSERRFIMNKGQLMGVESKLYFKSVETSDYGMYNCSLFYGLTSISKIVHLLPHNETISYILPFCLSAALAVFIGIIATICYFRKCRSKRFKKAKAPLQSVLLPSPTVDSCMEQELFLTRMNSLQSYQKEGSISLPSNKCFIFNNKQASKLSCGDFRNVSDEKVVKGNESNRSWDSGVCPDDTGYRNGHFFTSPVGQFCVSPFSTLASSNNSNDQTNQTLISPRYWQPTGGQLELINTQNSDNGSSKFSNNDMVNFNGSIHSAFLNIPPDPSVPMIPASPNQSFVCIPVEEYQQHMKIIRETQNQPILQPILQTFSPASYQIQNDNVPFSQTNHIYNNKTTPSQVSVQSDSITTKH